MHGNEVNFGHCVLLVQADCCSRLEAGFLNSPAYLCLGTSSDGSIVIFTLVAKTISNVELVRRDAPHPSRSRHDEPSQFS